MAAFSSIAAIASAFSAVSSLKSAFSKPKSSNTAAATNALDAKQEEDKRKLAKQKQQRKPTETFLTGGQGLAQGERLG